MKVLYWVGCVFLASFLITLLKYSGIVVGALPMILIEGSAFYLASRLCKNYDKKHKWDVAECPKDWICPQCQTENDKYFLVCKRCGAARPEKSVQQARSNIESNKAKEPNSSNCSIDEVSNDETVSIQQVKIGFCRKCGRELRKDSEFCSYCGTKVWREKE